MIPVHSFIPVIITLPKNAVSFLIFALIDDHSSLSLDVLVKLFCTYCCSFNGCVFNGNVQVMKNAVTTTRNMVHENPSQQLGPILTRI